ncbi:hypothetical protein KKG36_01230 [Patescibacteria group bacterium]|nr:hypothetical protein [Patescibacteria group bacterium]
MVKINYAELKFDHLVSFEKDNTVFACAKENGSGHTRLFLVFDGGNGRVYTRNGQANSWEELGGTDRDTIIGYIIAAKNNNIPVYKINGSHN